MTNFSFAQARKTMVENQLRPNKVKARDLLERFISVPREEFADSTFQHQAYTDTLLPMAEKRFMFAPMTLARILQNLELSQKENVLIVAGGTGYTAAIISPLVQRVTLVEEDGYLLDVAKKEILERGLANVEFKHDKPELGAPENSPYDCIIFDAAIEEIPEKILHQLKDGGKIGAVFTHNNQVKHATIFTKSGKTVFSEELFETKAHVLNNFKKEERFVF